FQSVSAPIGKSALHDGAHGVTRPTNSARPLIRIRVLMSAPEWLFVQTQPRRELPLRGFIVIQRVASAVVNLFYRVIPAAGQLFEKRTPRCFVVFEETLFRCSPFTNANQKPEVVAEPATTAAGRVRSRFNSGSGLTPPSPFDLRRFGQALGAIRRAKVQL